MKLVNIKNKILTICCDSFLLWFNSLATKGRLPLSHHIFILLTVINRYLWLLSFYFAFSIVVSLLTDFILKDKQRRKRLSVFLKSHATPELFPIYGNPGEAAIAKLAGKFLTGKAGAAVAGSVFIATTADHVCTHTGLYDSISFKSSIDAGMTSEEAMSRLPSRVSLADSFFKKPGK